MSRPGLAELEQSDLDLRVAVAWLVRDEIGIDESDLNAARRRAMFVLAAGGDPHRELDFESVAAEVTVAIALLRSDPDLAWRSLALALLADELADE